MTKEELKKLSKAQKLTQIFGNTKLGAKTAGKDEDETEAKENVAMNGQEPTSKPTLPTNPPVLDLEVEDEIMEAQFSPVTGFQSPPQAQDQRNEASFATTDGIFSHQLEPMPSHPQLNNAAEPDKPGFLHLVNTVYKQFLEMNIEEQGNRQRISNDSEMAKQS